MKRDLKKLEEKTFDLLIIGGGITGAAIAWDATLRGFSVALVDKRDFSEGTSSATSKLIHGGLRYLKNLEFSLVRESLRERRHMMRMAPHLVYPLPFYLSTRGYFTKQGLFYLPLGFILYDLLSFDRNRLPKGFPKIPAFRFLSRKKAAAMNSGSHPADLTGGIIYQDCQVYSPERMTIEFIKSAVNRGAVAANHATVTGFQVEDGKVKGATVKDSLTGKSHHIRAAMTINASGPWADITLNLATGNKNAHLLRSKGIHIITPEYTKDQVIGAILPDGKHRFLIPWRGRNLLGTTDTAYTDSPDRFSVTEEDVRGLLADAALAFPEYKIGPGDVEYYYGGMRPLVEDDTENKDVYQASRKFEIIDHETENQLGGFISVEGGKYTTSRALAETAVNLLESKLGRRKPCATGSLPLDSGDFGNYDEFRKELQKSAGHLLSRESLDAIARMYGRDASRIVEIAATGKKFSERLPGVADILAEVEYSLREEMPLTLEDMIFRRLGIGQLGKPESSLVRRVAEHMASHLKWNAARKKKEITRLMENYSLLDALHKKSPKKTAKRKTAAKTAKKKK